MAITEVNPLAEKHPYMSGAGGITAAVNQLRSAFPSKVTADTLKKLGIASNNESYVINILRFVGVLDANGGKTDKATSTFNKHNDAEFQHAFEEMVQDAYAELFSLRGSGAWQLNDDDLISFFRSSDQTSALVGKRQAGTFRALAALAGHGEAPTVFKQKGTKEVKPKQDKPTKAGNKPDPVVIMQSTGQPPQREFGLTVRVEVNLPQAADQDTYDRIFRSIRENLLNAK